MNLDDCIITCFCVIDVMMPMITKDQRLRARGPAPKLSDSEVITMEVVGSYLGLSQDQGLFDSFGRHYAHFSPALVGLHRTIFVRQTANLWAIKERLWCWLRDEVITYDPTMSIVDSVPLPVCRFARAPWCIRFRGQASYGLDHADRQTLYGFRVHALSRWPGLLTRMFLAPASVADGEIAPLLLQGTTGVVLGDRNYWLPDLQAFLRTQGIGLQARSAKRIRPKPQRTRVLFWGAFATLSTRNASQLTDRCQMKRVWARGVWHLRNHLLRSILMHTVCFFFNQQDGASCLQFDRLVA
jgi:Transposase DDE domain